MVVFRSERPVPYTSVEIIDKELERPENLEKKLTIAHGQFQLYM